MIETISERDSEGTTEVESSWDSGEESIEIAPVDYILAGEGQKYGEDLYF